MRIHGQSSKAGVRLLTLAPLILALFALSACDSANDQRVCTLEARPGITVSVMIDGGGIPANGVFEVTITDGSYTESEPIHDGRANLAYERAGTYIVTVSSDGNIVWTQNDVKVTSGECHVVTVELTALVEPN